MDAKELRMGNLVKKIDAVAGKVGVEYFERYHKITHSDIYHIVEDGDPTNHAIELTEDILIKCGFVKGIDDCFFIDCFFYDLISTSFYWDDESITHSDSIDIKYLHQLQNLYYCLTGKELEITL